MQLCNKIASFLYLKLTGFLLFKLSTSKVGKVAMFGIFGMGDNGKTWKCGSCGSKF